jgi:hypothetical protein
MFDLGQRPIESGAVDFALQIRKVSFGGRFPSGRIRIHCATLLFGIWDAALKQ